MHASKFPASATADDPSSRNSDLTYRSVVELEESSEEEFGSQEALG
jgi:hypothetical protein